MKRYTIKHIIGDILRCAAVCLAAYLPAACSDEESEPVAAGGEIYDGPLYIRGDIEGMLETRSTHPEGELKDDKEEWVLSCLWRYRPETMEDPNRLENFKATFRYGYGEFTDRYGKPVELKWSDLQADDKVWYQYSFALDNGPVGWNDDNTDTRIRSNYVDFAAFPDREKLIERYKAQWEPEDGRMAPNDLIAGHWDAEASMVQNTRWVEIPLRHVMSRVHVELSVAPTIGNLETDDVKIWINNLADTCYGFFRDWSLSKRGLILSGKETFVPVLIYPWTCEGRELWDWYQDTTYMPFKSDLYLTGSKDRGDKLLLICNETKNEKKDTLFRTHYLIMPPQTRSRENPSLEPRLHIEINEKTYSGVLPAYLKTGTGQELFSEFGSGKNITLKAEINDNPPEIKINATVLPWKDLGTWLLDTDMSGIRTDEEFKEAVDAYNAYAANDGATWTTGETKPEAIERYGSFNGGKFTFHFFGDFNEEAPNLPDNHKIKAGQDKFDVDLHGHTVYGCTGKDTQEPGTGKDSWGETLLKKKMMSDN